MRYTKRQMEHMAFVATQPSLLLSEDWLEQDAEIKRLRAEVKPLELRNKSQANVIHALMKESKQLTTLREAAVVVVGWWEEEWQDDDRQGEMDSYMNNLRIAVRVTSPPADEADDGQGGG